MSANPLEHVLDQKHEWPIFDRLFGGWSIPLPSFTVFGHEFCLTKFMILEVIAAILIAAIFIPLCRRATAGGLPKGPWWNAFESLLTFVRDEVATPNIGEHDADRFVPYLWTLFLFILFCNLLGMVPVMASPTASVYMTAGLAVISFLVFHGAAIAKMGAWHYVKSLWPKIDVKIMGPFVLSPLIFGIEFISSIIKSGVLAIRLFANMFAGHTVLAMILMFIVVAGENGFSVQWSAVTLSSVLGVVALSLLELFVAFLQAYIFTFLTALFMGMALHPEH
jgi:F-type H+-transporting ATPase subunit a